MIRVGAVALLELRLRPMLKGFVQSMTNKAVFLLILILTMLNQHK